MTEVENNATIYEAGNGEEKTSRVILALIAGDLSGATVSKSTEKDRVFINFPCQTG